MANTDYKMTRDHNVYVIANLPTEYQVKYKYYADIFNAVADAPAGATIVVGAGRYNIDSIITTTKQINYHFEAGAVLNLQNSSVVINPNQNITGYLDLIMTGPLSNIQISNGVSDFNNVSIQSITTDSPAAVLLGCTGTLNLRIGRITTTNDGLASMQINSLSSNCNIEIGYTNGAIFIDTSSTQVAVAGTIRNTTIETLQTATGAIDIYNDGAVTLTVLNSRLHNVRNASGASGISNEVTSGAVIVKLINSIIQTTHASSVSVDSDTPATLTLMAFGSGANKAVGANVTESVTGGLLVEADITI